MIHPFCERTVLNGMTFGLSSASYDIRVAEDVEVRHGFFCLASSVERFNMPLDLIARVADKSSLARRGVAVQNTVLEPGWRGHLTLEISNHSGTYLVMEAGSPIAQVIFELLDQPTEQPYVGKYQDQSAGPQPAIFERD